MFLMYLCILLELIIEILSKSNLIYKNPLLVQQNVIKCMKEKYGVENFSKTETKQIIAIEKRNAYVVSYRK